MASSVALNALKALSKKSKVVAKVCEEAVDEDVLDLTTDLAEPEAEEEVEEVAVLSVKRPIAVPAPIAVDEEEDDDEDEEVEYEYYYEEEEEEEEEADEVEEVVVRSKASKHTVSLDDIDSVIRLVRLIQKNGDVIVAALESAQ